ncbi:MAG TPA: response regulator transcription factor [Arenimonas sp.]|jgi:two-component system uhpT operon response regulator UhpA|uniref:response regulator transcription factor n=1 Tax=Arenimonas sp. TaxID=1872635 RepID=UPI002D80E7C1|nr:response regulator transcription factor [Arenimonas sp.]HEU0154124.1 response regulator transcription factor [Arenimonas sp.]
MIRVLLIDDHAIVREGFKRLIESSPGFLVVAEARNADEALSALERVSADIAVVDISLGDGASSGLDLIALLRDLMHGLRCVVLSMHDDSGLVLRALEQGARGYFTKAVAADELLDGLRRVAAGEVVLSSDLAPPVSNPAPLLTPRERATLRGLLSDRPPKAIAYDLGISDKTLYRHRANLMEKLGARNSTELARIARERGLLADLG